MFQECKEVRGDRGLGLFDIVDGFRPRFMTVASQAMATGWLYLWMGVESEGNVIFALAKANTRGTPAHVVPCTLCNVSLQT